MNVRQEFELREKAYNGYYNSLLLQSESDNPDKNRWWHIDNVINQLSQEMPKTNKRWLKWLKSYHKF